MNRVKNDAETKKIAQSKKLMTFREFIQLNSVLRKPKRLYKYLKMK